ncbi:MAG: HAD family hydrolase [Longimicrobiales bacterium]
MAAFPGAQELLEPLRYDGRTLVVATSASEKDVRALLKQARLEYLIDRWTNSDEADASKPAHDIIQAAVKKARVDASETVCWATRPTCKGGAARRCTRHRPALRQLE